MDSATLLYWTLQQQYVVQAITYVYPSRPARELTATRAIARAASVDCREVALPFLQTAVDLREAASTALPGVQAPEGYVPARNFVFYAVAAYFAEVYGADLILGGHVQTDREGFPDATPAFFHAIECLVNSVTSRDDRALRVCLPFLEKTKGEVVTLAQALRVPLDLTWSCYYDRATPCGRCESCVERADAFTHAGIRAAPTRGDPR